MLQIFCGLFLSLEKEKIMQLLHRKLLVNWKGFKERVRYA